jgi:predicted RNA-binding protein with PUA-like domain
MLSAAVPRYWLLKSDPEEFGLADLERSPRRTTCWSGVRNYQARNLLRDELRCGDSVLFYHSQANPPAIVGTASVVREGYPDPTQDPADPRWFAVDIRFESELRRPVTLPELRAARGLEKMVLLHRSRLSVQPVTAAEWRIIAGLAARKKDRP